MEAPESKLGFNRSYSKIKYFSLMQSLNTSSLTNNSLQNLANKISRMKHISVFSINNTSMKIRSIPPSFWSSMKIKLFSPIANPIMVIIILLLIIILYFKCFQNIKDCVCKYTGPHYPLPNSAHINPETILLPLPNNQDDISPQIIEEILKTCGVDLAKFKCYKHHKARFQTT